MKYALSLLLSLFLLNLSIDAQEITFDTIFITKEYNNFFHKYPFVTSIDINSKREDFFYLTTNEKTDTHQKSVQYNLKFEGDRYLFAKKFSYIPIPEVYNQILSQKVCKYHWRVFYHLVPDTIYARLTYICSIPEDDIYFESVEKGVRYSKNIKNLATEIQASLAKLTLRDSIFLLKAIASKDSTLSDFQIQEAKDTVAANVIIKVLAKSGPWLPAYQGGRPVKSYVRFLIQALADHSVRLSFSL